MGAFIELADLSGAVNGRAVDAVYKIRGIDPGLTRDSPNTFKVMRDATDIVDAGGDLGVAGRMLRDEGDRIVKAGYFNADVAKWGPIFQDAGSTLIALSREPQPASDDGKSDSGPGAIEYVARFLADVPVWAWIAGGVATAGAVYYVATSEKS